MPFEQYVQHAAIHEAGHIVVALALGFHLAFAILRVDDEGVAGYTEVVLFPVGGKSQAELVAAATTPAMLRLRSMHALAGWVAEGWVNESEADLEQGSEGDIKNALRFARLALGDNDATWFAYVTERIADVRQVLTPLDLRVIRVANYLIAHPNEEVPGDILKAVVAENGTE